MSKLRIKTGITLLTTVFTFSFLYSTMANAQEDTTADTTTATTTTDKNETTGKSEGYLKEIRDILLINVNKLPVYLNQLAKMALSWLAPDDTETTAIQQKNFAKLADAELQTLNTQRESQTRFIYDFLKRNPAMPDEGLLGTEFAPVINSINYQTLLSQPFSQPSQQQLQQFQNQDDPAYNYTQFASALNIRHKKPPKVRPSVDKNYLAAIGQYYNYYMTTSAVQTYNGYILSELYADAKNKNATQKARDALVEKASETNWFTQIASENIGIVLRQILMYSSQTYVLLADLLETQKKLLTAQTMNNALLIAVNQDTERRIYQRANGEPPTP